MIRFDQAYKALRWVATNAKGPCSVLVGQERAEYNPGKNVVLDFFPTVVFDAARYSGD